MLYKVLNERVQNQGKTIYIYIPPAVKASATSGFKLISALLLPLTPNTAHTAPVTENTLQRNRTHTCYLSLSLCLPCSPPPSFQTPCWMLSCNGKQLRALMRVHICDRFAIEKEN